MTKKIYTGLVLLGICALMSIWCSDVADAAPRNRRPRPSPIILTATAVSSEQINLSWITKYRTIGPTRIERSLDGLLFTEIATVPINTISYEDQGLDSETTYYYRVYVTTRRGSGYSNIADATTHAGGGITEAAISGTVSYGGGLVGIIRVLAAESQDAWTSPYSTTADAVGNFIVTAVPVPATYWIKAFIDINSNGIKDPGEPWGASGSNPIEVTNDITDIYILVQGKVEGIRLDFGYCYGGYYAGMSTRQVVDLIVSTCKQWGVNRIYARALSTVYGTYWANPTTPYLTAEGGHGVNDIFRLLINKAHQEGIMVLAYIEPNRNKGVWDARPDWREKDINGNDFKPELYPLSVYNLGYLSWTESLINEFLDIGVDGIDIAECDYTVWGTAATYDQAANEHYFAEYPQGSLGDTNWVNLRKRVLTEWYSLIGSLVHARGKEFHITYTWNASSDGRLFDEKYLSDYTGFSFEQILNLPEDSKPHFIVAELIWQGLAAIYGKTVFTAEWTGDAAGQFVAFVNNRAQPVVHVEATPFSSNYTIVPDPGEIEISLRLALENSGGADIYDYHQIYTTLYDYKGIVKEWARDAVTNVYKQN